jgi:hypothetical protein
MPSDDIVARLRGHFSSPTAIAAADEIERLRAVIKTQQDRIEQSVRDNDRTVYLCAARYHRLQTIRDLVVKHGVVDPLRHEIMRQTDSLD